MELAVLGLQKIDVSSFSIVSFLKLMVAKTCIISCMRSNYGKMGPLTMELLTLSV